MEHAGLSGSWIIRKRADLNGVRLVIEAGVSASYIIVFDAGSGKESLRRVAMRFEVSRRGVAGFSFGKEGNGTGVMVNSCWGWVRWRVGYSGRCGGWLRIRYW